MSAGWDDSMMTWERLREGAGKICIVMAMGVEMVYVKRAVSWRFGTGSGEGPGTALEAARTCRNLQCDDTGSGNGPGMALEAVRTCRIQWEMSQGARECLVSTGSCRRSGRASALQDLIVF